MTGFGDQDLYERALVGLLASWEANARGTAGAAVLRSDGVAAAVFPAGPEREIYNNAVLRRGLADPGARAAAVDAMEAAYAAAGVDAFAAWTDDGDAPMRAELDRRGYRVTESTLIMAIDLASLPPLVPRPEIVPARWGDYLDYLRRLGLADDLLAGVDPEAYRVAAARLDGSLVATGLAFEYEDDCAIFNVSTLDPYRRRGLATALTASLLTAAWARGCTTATLQSTPVAERVYASLGFRPLGRFVEYAR